MRGGGTIITWKELSNKMGGQFGGEFKFTFDKEWIEYLQTKTNMYNEQDIDVLENQEIDVDVLKNDTKWSNFGPFKKIKDSL
jgi:hypothetical protein